MALTSSYLVSVKNVKSLFDSLIGAKAPEAFTQKFIENLGFKSTNDRLYISILKGIGFLDESAAPTEVYFKFLDQTESKKVLATAIEGAYSDLFAINKLAQTLEVSEVKNKLRSLTQGKYSENVIGWMATTFKALCEYAEWGNKENKKELKEERKIPDSIKIPIEEIREIENKPENFSHEGVFSKIKQKPEFHYNIQIHLPDSRDEAVYDAIFKSLKKHLL